VKLVGGTDLGRGIRMERRRDRRRESGWAHAARASGRDAGGAARPRAASSPELGARRAEPAGDAGRGATGEAQSKQATYMGFVWTDGRPISSITVN
jgi:hypothetical protein